MPILPSDFCRVASEIVLQAKPIQGEAAWRTAAGRAYYSVYLATRDALREVHGRPTFDPTHGMWDLFSNVKNSPKVQRFGLLGSNLYTWRRRSDYYPDKFTVTDEKAQELAEECDTALVLLESVRAELPLPAERAARY